MNVVTVTVSGDVGTGKSAICGEIEILCKALRIPVEWKGGRAEKGLTHADWTDALEMYSPHVEIVEVNTNQIRRLTDSHAALLAALERVRQNIPDMQICCECPRTDGFDMEPQCCNEPDKLHDVIDAAIKTAKELGC